MQWQSQQKWMFRQGVDSLMEVLGHAELKAVQRYGSRSRERTRRAMQVFESGQACAKRWFSDEGTDKIRVEIHANGSA